MKKTFARLGFVALILFGGFVGAARAEAPSPSAPSIHVLFIGNSFTYVNDLPKMVAELAKAGGQRPLLYERQTPGGCTLEKHWKDGIALTKIKSRRWDYVVLQGNSQAALRWPDALFEYGKKFDAEIGKQGAKTILYMTWALQKRPQDQAVISKAYDDLAETLKSQLAPVGDAWKAAMAADKNLVLHGKDHKHPNFTGTYLAACVFYATIYDKSPEGLPGSIGKLTDEQAYPLQKIAWETVLKTGKKLSESAAAPR